jgi:flagellar export protein FliJ
MRYRFRFETLCQYRDSLLKRAQTEMALALRNIDDNEARQTVGKEQLDAEASKWEERQRQGMGVGEFLAYGNRIQTLEQDLLKLEREHVKLTQELARVKQRVMERERDLKALELLEERERESFAYDLKKKEQGSIDEFAILRRGKRNVDTDGT